MSGVAVPLTDRSGTTIAALNVSTNSDRVSVRMVKDAIVPLLLDGAATIRRELELLRDEANTPATPEAKRDRVRRSSPLQMWR